MLKFSISMLAVAAVTLGSAHSVAASFLLPQGLSASGFMAPQNMVLRAKNGGGNSGKGGGDDDGEDDDDDNDDNDNSGSGSGNSGSGSGDDDDDDDDDDNSGSGSGGSNSGSGGSGSSGSAASQGGSVASQVARIEIGRNSIVIIYRNGWVESLADGFYELRDAKNRRVIRRQAGQGDKVRFETIVSQARSR